MALLRSGSFIEWILHQHDKKQKEHHVSRWEGLPLTSVDSVVETEDGGTALMVDGIKEDEHEKQENSIKKNPIKLLKMAIPHIILICILLTYVAAGSAVLQRLEKDTEVTIRMNRLILLNETFRRIVDETWTLKSKEMNYDQWYSHVYDQLLQNISVMYEKTKLTNSSMVLETQWTFPTAVLYTLTVLTACGYSHIDPLTDTGKLFAVGFALVGIPLMFITAADIGKFLSETFKKVCQFWRRCNRAFLWKFCRKRMKERDKAAAAAASAAGKSPDGLEELMDGDGGGGADGEESGLWFPISAYLVLMCLYCSIGAILFRSYENDWGFVHAFHFAFNTVVTVGMGNVVVTNIFYLCMIVAYVIIGLAVVTMCVDLASTHLQRYFQKIHYFGRARRRFLGMGEDIREMVALIAAMRKKKGGKVTWNDLKQFMESEAGAAWEGRLASFIPRNVHLWKYIDETSSAMSTYRHNSLNSCSSMASGAPPPTRADRRQAKSAFHNRFDHRDRSNRISRTMAAAACLPEADLATLIGDAHYKHELTPPEPRNV